MITAHYETDNITLSISVAETFSSPFYDDLISSFFQRSNEAWGLYHKTYYGFHKIES
jgi:hypothetical protein